jgi:queuosine precursor transporter
MKHKSLIVWTLTYIFVIALANLTATVFIPILWGIQISVGTILFGFVFTIRDKLHEFGRKHVYQGIFLASAVSLLVLLPSISSGDPVSIRILIASITALVLSESTDTEIFQRLLALPWIRRVLISNVFSVPLDSILFNMMAFFGTFLTPQIPGLILGEILYKYISSTLLAYFILYISAPVKRLAKSFQV